MKTAVMWAISIAAAVGAPSAMASDWMRVGTDTNGNSWMVDRESLIREPGLVRAWKRIEFSKVQPYPPTGALISVALFLDVTNCGKRLVGVKASKLLASDGSVIAAHEDPDDRIQWQSVAPDSVVEKTMQFVCAVPTVPSK